MADPSIWGDDKINVPVLAIMAKNPFYPPNVEESFRAIAPNMEFHMWDGVGHFIMMEKPKEFNEAVVQFLNTIQARNGGEWQEDTLGAIRMAVDNMGWRSYAKKVIILVGSSPPHEKDVPALKKLVDEWHARGGVVSTIDVSLVLHREHERKIYRWLHGEDPKEISPLPDFYKQVSDSFGEIAREGGGELIAMDQQQAVVRHLLALTFGPKWEKDVARIARGF